MDNIDFGNINLVYYRHNLFSEVGQITFGSIDYNELTLVIDGTMTYVINGKEYVLNKGDALFTPTGSTRIRKNGTSADYVSFNFISDKPITCFNVITKQVFNNEIKMLLKYYDACTANTLSHVKQKCTNILYGLLINLYEFYYAPKYSKITLDIIKILQDNTRQQITLKDIESKVFFSPYYFCKKFKNEMGVSVIQYFNKMKIEQAKMLIAEQAMSLEEIAFYLGFSDYNYFSRLFKKLTKWNPTKYKTQYLTTSQK